jgi:hypothetical protein
MLSTFELDTLGTESSRLFSTSPITSPSKLTRYINVLNRIILEGGSKIGKHINRKFQNLHLQICPIYSKQRDAWTMTWTRQIIAVNSSAKLWSKYTPHYRFRQRMVYVGWKHGGSEKRSTNNYPDERNMLAMCCCVCIRNLLQLDSTYLVN